MSQSGAISSSGGGGGGVNSVSGTLNRITSTGGANPVIDIAATYVGQTSLTTLGTVTTGTWNATAIGAVYGGTGQTTYATGDILYASAANTLSKLAAGSNTQVLTLAAGVPSWATPTTGTVTSVSGTANRITSTGGATPVIDISASYVGQSSITTLGTITTGVWNGTTIDVSHGGTGDTTLTNHGVLIGQGTSAVVATASGTAGQILQSGGSGADPLYSTATYPSTVTTGDLLYSSATNVVSSLAISANPGVPLISLGTNLEWSTPQSDIFLFDDFLTTSNAGNTGYTQNQQNAGSSSGTNISVSGHPGVIGITTGTSTNGAAMVGHGGVITTGDGRTLHNFLLRVPVLSDGTDTFTVRVGLQEVSSATGDVVDGAYFEYTNAVNSGAWTIKTANNSSRTTANTATTVDTNWHLYTVDINAAGTSVDFSIDGVPVTNSPIATNIPASTRFFSDGFRITKSAGTVARLINVDFSMLWKKMTSNRY